MNATGTSGSEDAAAPTGADALHDRITQAYLGELGERFMQRTHRRIHWMCGQVRGRRVLDIGCSQGIVSLLLARAGHEVTGIDLDPKVVAEADAYLASEPPEVRARVRFIHGDASDLRADGSFDTVVLGEILEHLEDPGWLIDTAAGQLAPGGRLVATVPFGINDFPDHRQTFYLSAPFALISRRFEVTEVETMGRWIGFAAEKPAGAPAARPLDAVWVPVLEEGIRRLERMFLDEQATIRQRLERVQAKTVALERRLQATGEARDRHEARAGALARELGAVRVRVGELEADAVRADERARTDAQRIRGLRARLEMMEASTSFRLGHALVLGAKSPGRLARWPAAAAKRLWREARFGRPRPSPRTARVRPAILAKLRPDPARQLSVLEAVPPPAPRAIEPIAGRVVYVLHNSLPWSSGGYAMRAHGLALGMAEAGLEMVCLTRPGFPLDTKPELTAAALPLCDTIDGIDYRRLITPLRTNALVRDYMLAAADALEAELRRLRPEWVLAASNYITALPALIAARRLGLPFLYEVRGFWEVTRRSREPGFERSAAFRVYERMEADVARRADHVFTLTGPMRDELVRRGVDLSTITLLPNSCDPGRFAPRGRDAALAARLGIPASVPVIGYIGTFVQYEGLEDLVAACAMLQRRGRDFRLMLIGNENVSGTEKGPITAEIERVAAAAGLSDRLIMPGRVPHEEVAAYYSLIDIAPFPRKPQPVTEMVSPMKPLEALAMEKAVVVSSVAALTGMIADEKTGLVFAKGDIASLADVLDRLIGDPGLRARLGRNGRDWVVRERNWAEMGRRARATLDTLAPVAILSGPGAGPQKG